MTASSIHPDLGPDTMSSSLLSVSLESKDVVSGRSPSFSSLATSGDTTIKYKRLVRRTRGTEGAASVETSLQVFRRWLKKDGKEIIALHVVSKGCFDDLAQRAP